MDANEQTRRFAEDLDKLVDRYSDEYDVTYAQVVGVLTMKAHSICHENDEED